MLFFDPTLNDTTLAPVHWVAEDDSVYVTDFTYKWWEFRATINAPNMTDPGYIDTFYGHVGSNHFVGDQWSDTMFGEGGTDTLDGQGGDDHLYGGEDNDLIYGKAGDDVIYGGSENDTMFGGDDSDEFYGGTGSDKQYGGAGRDYFYADNGADVIDGGAGTDLVMYTQSSAAVTINLQTGTGIGGHAHGDKLSNVEVVFGSIYDDVLLGSSQSDALAGWHGRDEIRGGGGDDNITGGENGAGINGGDQMWGDAGNDVFRFTNDDSGGMAGSIDTIWDFDQNGNDQLLIYVDDHIFAESNWGAVDAYVNGIWGTLVLIKDKDSQGVVATTQEIFLAGQTASEMGADDFTFDHF